MASAFCLKLTIFFGFVFTVVIGVFGFVLIDDTAVGLPRKVGVLSKNLGAAASAIESIQLSDFQALQTEAITSRVLRLRSQKPDSTQSLGHQEIQAAVESWRVTKDLGSLDQVLSRAIAEFPSDANRQERYYLAALKQAHLEIKELVRREDLLAGMEQSLAGLTESVASIGRDAPILQASLDQGPARLSEILKRLAIGLIVTTFFLAILKWMAGIFRTYHNEMLRVERDDMLVRRFYVAFKGADGLSEHRKQIISALLNESHEDSEKNSQALDNATVEAVKGALLSIAEKISKT